MIADQDSPHRITLNAMYEFPLGKGKRFLSSSNWFSNAAFGGWQFGGTLAYQRGFPIAFGNMNIDGTIGGADLFYKGSEIALPSNQMGTYRWFNTAAFTSILNSNSTAASPANHLRTLPFRFSSVRRDNVKNIDLALKKDILLREGMKIQGRFEVANAFNEPYFQAPVVNPTTVGSVVNPFGVCNNTEATPCIGSFGTISQANVANWPRKITLGVKFIF
jgi:hypothetical protein